MSQTLHVANGDLVIREGDQTNGFYILIAGTLEVSVDGHPIEQIDAPGTIFGEMSQILGRPRTTTVRALSDCELAHVSTSIDQLVVSHPTIASKLILTLAQRLERANQRIRDLTPRPGSD